MQGMDRKPRLCNYEGSDYRADFWEGQGREYEDLAERIALRHLLPPAGRRLLDIGAGFGRLSEFYAGYDQVILLDYSRSLLRQARKRLGCDGRLLYVAASFYAMPFLDQAIDTALMVRVMHHVEDVPALLGEVVRVLVGGGNYVLEFASKRHLKAILRYALGQQAWSPFDRAPYEFLEMNFDFHPAWMRQRLVEAGFHVKRQRTVSHFRLPLLKRLVPAPALATLDGLCQPTGAWWQLTPSIFLQSAAQKPGRSTPTQDLFRCPACTGANLKSSPQALCCETCGRRWPIEDGIYDFKAPLPA
jgi:ubiquinone/menaquinone biosynthesis C-methylase UbiE